MRQLVEQLGWAICATWCTLKFLESGESRHVAMHEGMMLADDLWKHARTRGRKGGRVVDG